MLPNNKLLKSANRPNELQNQTKQDAAMNK